MTEPTAQELAALFKWTICTKFAAMEETKATNLGEQIEVGASCCLMAQSAIFSKECC